MQRTTELKPQGRLSLSVSAVQQRNSCKYQASDSSRPTLCEVHRDPTPEAVSHQHHGRFARIQDRRNKVCVQGRAPWLRWSRRSSESRKIDAHCVESG